jgi:hypothetical protein
VVELVELMLVLQEVTRLWWVHDGVTVPAVDVTSRTPPWIARQDVTPVLTPNKTLPPPFGSVNPMFHTAVVPLARNMVPLIVCPVVTA